MLPQANAVAVWNTKISVRLKMSRCGAEAKFDAVFHPSSISSDGLDMICSEVIDCSRTCMLHTLLTVSDSGEPWKLDTLPGDRKSRP